MSAQHVSVVRGVILDKETTFTLGEFCQICGARRSLVVEMIEEGIVEAEGTGDDWRFRGDAVVRAHRALRLMRDLDLNLPGAALAVDLLEQLDRFREGTLTRHTG
jgi:chaperone modulatory protein CbpM